MRLLFFVEKSRNIRIKNNIFIAEGAFMDWVSAIKEIEKAQEDDRLVIFVGAGVSKNSGVPSWWALIKKFADELNYSRCSVCKKKTSDCPTADCKDRYEYTQEEFLRIPEYYYQQDISENHANYFNLIFKTLHCDNGPNPIDDEIFSILPRHIITTNYDQLLEKSQSVNSMLYTVVTRDSDLLAEANDRYIIKMHGDLENPDTIVLKESDYIKYEQEHPLISTFIKSLLVNHTFVFLGYSLNDNNLNLIIGWINYFRELHGVEERPANFWISSKPATAFEKARLENRNIYVVDLSSLPTDLEKKVDVPNSITNGTGQKLFTFLRCITNPKISYEYIPIEDRITEKYHLLKSYSKISYQDLIAVQPLGHIKFFDTELIFYDKIWYECIQKLLSNRASGVMEVFRRAGISAIRLCGNSLPFQVSDTCEPIDYLLQLYFDNDYISINTKLETCEDSIQKMYYSYLLQKDKQHIQMLIKHYAKQHPPTDYISVLLYKMRSRLAMLSYFEFQESITLELQRAFNISPPERYKGAVSFLKMLFDSPAKNMHKMEDILSKHEERYAFNNRTTYFYHSYSGIWELKAYAYDYYFFFKVNKIPLDYFSDSKEYLSCYLKAVLCSYSPESSTADIWKIGLHKEERNYPISEVDLDMFVKFTSPKLLKSWLEKYSVQHLVIEDGFEVTKKFVNLCDSFSQFGIQRWAEMIHSFTMILCLIDLDESSVCSIFKALKNVILKASEFKPVMAEWIFDAIDIVLNHISIESQCIERNLLLDALLADNIYNALKERKSGSFGYILRKFADVISLDVKNRIRQHIEVIEDITQKIDCLYYFRSFYTEEFCCSFFEEHFDYLSSEQCYRLLIEEIIPFDKKCWSKFISILEQEDMKRMLQPGVYALPDWLIDTLEKCIILKLLGFSTELDSLEPYAHYSEHLSFMLNPESFDYSQVNTENYMWQNLIYSKEYQPYFIEHKSEILSDELRKSFDLCVATKEQQKIVYGILLNRDELQQF